MIFFTFLITKKERKYPLCEWMPHLATKIYKPLRRKQHTGTVSPDLVEFCFDFTAQRNERKKEPKMRYFFRYHHIFKFMSRSNFPRMSTIFLFSFYLAIKTRHFVLFSSFVCVKIYIDRNIYFYPFIRADFFFLFVPKVQHHSICSSSGFFYCVMEFAFSLNLIYHI